MSIRPKYGKRSVLQVLSDGMSQHPPTGKSCCEEAALNAAEVDRLTLERDEARALAESKLGYPPLDLRHADLTNRAEKAEAERDEAWKEAEVWRKLWAKVANQFIAGTNEQQIEHERDELQAKLDDLTMTVKELAPAFPEWLGDVPDPDDIEIERGPHGDFYADDGWTAHANATAHGLRKWVFERAELSARYEAIARFIEAEEAKRNAEDEQRIEEQAKALAEAVFRYGGPWDNVAESARERCRAAIRAGWGKEEKA